MYHWMKLILIISDSLKELSLVDEQLKTIVNSAMQQIIKLLIINDFLVFF